MHALALRILVMRKLDTPTQNADMEALTWKRWSF
jgi:hypothetical protein